MEPEPEPRHSQASSHFPLEPFSAATLFDVETARRKALQARGPLLTGCTEVDDYVLCGGFRRGEVVGLSAEEADMGLLLGLQTIAHGLVASLSSPAASQPRAALVTTLAAPEILPLLRDVVRAQVHARFGQGNADFGGQVRRCLERISISRVFDIEGLWEVLGEIETVSASAAPDSGEAGEAVDAGEPQPSEQEPPESSQRSVSPSASPVPSLPPLRHRPDVEIGDSEDEGGFSTSPSAASIPSPVPAPITAASPPATEAAPAAPQPRPTDTSQPAIPDIILITHFSSLLSGLFTHRDKSSAHTSLQLLASHLRYLARSAGPLVLLLNGTTSPPAQNNHSSSSSSSNTNPTAAGRPADRQLDPSLRSIFNPAPPPPRHDAGYAAHALSRRNKPAFGLTFTQFLDLHLLCTRVPRSRADAEAAFAPVASAPPRQLRYAWVVEVLLDEQGVWREAGGRVVREQRWAAVDVRDGVGVVAAFEGGGSEARQNTEPIRLAAGFGGRRV